LWRGYITLNSIGGQDIRTEDDELSVCFLLEEVLSRVPARLQREYTRVFGDRRWPFQMGAAYNWGDNIPLNAAQREFWRRARESNLSSEDSFQLARAINPRLSRRYGALYSWGTHLEARMRSASQNDDRLFVFTRHVRYDRLGLFDDEDNEEYPEWEEDAEWREGYTFLPM
jgi:hypothetical protein